MTMRTLLSRSLIILGLVGAIPLGGATRAADLPACAASDVVLLDGLQYNKEFVDHKGVTPLEHAQVALAGGGIASIPFGPFELSRLVPQKVASEVAFLKPRVIVLHYSAFEGRTVGPTNSRLGDFLKQINLEMRAAPPTFVFYSAAFPDRSAPRTPKLQERIDQTAAVLAKLMGIGAPMSSRRASFSMADPNSTRFTTPRSIRELLEGVRPGLTGCRLS